MANVKTDTGEIAPGRSSKLRRSNPLDAPGRRRPKQKRSKETVDQMLEAAIRVMEQGGFEAFTMRAVAEEAGMNVATLYSYFANKHKLLARLAEDRLNERLDMLRDAFDEARASRDWIEGAAASTLKMSELRSRQTGSRALRLALHAAPELWRIDQEGNRAAGRMLAELIRDCADPLCKDPELRGRMIAEYVTVLLDLLPDIPEEKHPAVHEELVALIRHHLRMP